MTKISKHDWEVREADWQAAKRFVARHHYSKGCSNTRVHAHGLFRKGGDELFGVAAWLPPTKVAAQSVNREMWTRVLALSRLVVHPDVPANGATFLMARSMRLIAAGQKWVSLVTYADEFMGHTGAIYRAANWEYIGRMKGSPRWEDADGRPIAKKATRTRTDQEMRDLGYRNVGVFAKHKFVKHLPQRRQPLGGGVP